VYPLSHLGFSEKISKLFEEDVLRGLQILSLQLLYMSMEFKTAERVRLETSVQRIVSDQVNLIKYRNGVNGQAYDVIFLNLCLLIFNRSKSLCSLVDLESIG
jgi:hypothetical protein